MEKSLRIANETNSVLQQRLDDVEIENRNTLLAMDGQMKRLYETVRTLTRNNVEQNEQVICFLKKKKVKTETCFY
jgi:hypothetical protein